MSDKIFFQVYFVYKFLYIQYIYVDIFEFTNTNRFLPIFHFFYFYFFYLKRIFIRFFYHEYKNNYNYN